jgi:hypothetical protein
MARSTVIGLALLLSACAGNRASSTAARNGTTIELTEKGHGLFVGHTDSGEVVVSASHYNAMNGLAVLDTDLGVPAKDSNGMMLCQREMRTGTHVPRWVCRYQSIIEQERQITQLGLDMPIAGPHPSQGGSGAALSQGPGLGRGGRTASQ